MKSPNLRKLILTSVSYTTEIGFPELNVTQHVLSFIFAVKTPCLDTLAVCETAKVNWTQKQEN